MPTRTGARTIEKVDSSGYRIDEEIKNLQSFLKSQNLWLPSGFFSQIQKGDIVEIYAFPEHRQIYANSEFLRMSSYSSEQMRTIPFHQLFWRSDEVQKQLLERAAEVAQKSEETESWGLEPHELVESLHPRKRTFEMKMGLLSPCRDVVSNERRAWASTLQVQLIYEWPETAL